MALLGAGVGSSQMYNKAIKFVPATKARPPPGYLRVASAAVFGGVTCNKVVIKKLIGHRVFLNT